MNEKMAQLIDLVLSISLESEYMVYISGLSGVGVDVGINKPVLDELGYRHEMVERFDRVDRHPEKLQAALEAAAAVKNGTYAGGATDVGSIAV